MIATTKRIGSVAGRVHNQLKHDKRMVILSVVFPALIIYFIKILFDVLASPMFDITIYVFPYSAFIVHFITFVLTAIVVVRERTAGTLERMFVSGYNQVEIVSGYLLTYTLLATIQSLVVLIEINWVFELGYEFSRLASMYLILWLLAVISMGIGMLVSNFSRNEGQVFPFIPLVVLSVIISGIILPVEKLPEWVQPMSYLTPLYYANEALQPLIAGDVLGDHLDKVLLLFVYGLLLLSVVVFTLREKD